MRNALKIGIKIVAGQKENPSQMGDTEAVRGSAKESGKGGIWCCESDPL